MFCYCGECPKDIARREDYMCLCIHCSKQEEGYMELNLVYVRCDGCDRLTFCHAVKESAHD